MVDGSGYIFLLIRLVRRLLRAARGSRWTLFKLNGFQAIRRRFLEDIAEKTIVSPFPFPPPTEKLEALRVASIESHELFSDRGLMSLFGFRVLPTGMARKESSFFLARPSSFPPFVCHKSGVTEKLYGRDSRARRLVQEIPSGSTRRRLSALYNDYRQNTRRASRSFLSVCPRRYQRESISSVLTRRAFAKWIALAKVRYLENSLWL